MKNILNQFIALLFIICFFLPSISAQEDPANELNYEVNRVYPYISITKEKLLDAQTLMDLNPHFQASWIKEYFSVEITANLQGVPEQEVGKNEMLTPEQKELILRADAGTDIAVNVRYLPNNNLRHNDPKELPFSFSIEPEVEATYPGGQQFLKKYLKENAVDKIPDGTFKEYELAAVKFTIDEKGAVVDVHLFWPSKDEAVDELLLTAVRSMPLWEPAACSDGTKVKQEFVFTAGNMESCVVPLLNIRRDY